MSDIGNCLTFVGIVIIAMLLSIYMFKIGYRTGQIDAISGVDIQYELVTNPDKSVEWKRIEGK